MRDGDRVVDRRTGPAVRLAVEDAVEVEQLGDDLTDLPRPPRAVGALGVISAWCVTSRPTIVTSRPLSKTPGAASGSAQMLNSAAGVTLPSADRAAHQDDPLGAHAALEEQRDVRQRPGRDEDDTGAKALWRGTRPRARRPARPCAAGSAGPSRPVSPWTLAANRRAGGPGAVGSGRDGTSARPASSSTRKRIRGRLLERLVAGDGRDAEQLDLGAGEREQERDRVVVAGVAVDDDRRAHNRHTSTQCAPDTGPPPSKCLQKRNSGERARTLWPWTVPDTGVPGAGDVAASTAA